MEASVAFLMCFSIDCFYFTVVGPSRRNFSQQCCCLKMTMLNTIMLAVQIAPLDSAFSVLLSYLSVLVLYNLLLCQGESGLYSLFSKK